MKRFLTLSHFRLALEALLVVLLAVVALTRSAGTQAAPQSSGEVPNAYYWYQCNNIANSHVAVFSTRVHLWCQSTTSVSGGPALNGIYYFSVPTSPDSPLASRFMSLMQTAVIANRTVWVELDPNDTSGTSFGCGSANCRRIIGMELR
jgi:hypothetical protein